MDGPGILSTDELTWLQASLILDSLPGVPQKKDQHIFMSDISIPDSSSANHSASPTLPPNVLTASESGNTLNSIRSDSLASSSRSASHVAPRNAVCPTASRSEWIYRHPKQPLNAHPRNATVKPSLPRPFMGRHDTMTPLIRSDSTASTRTTTQTASITSSSQSFHAHSRITPSSSTGPFWSTILRPRSRSERSMPLLKTIPSQSQIVLTPNNEASTKRISSPKVMSARPPSISSTLSSASTPSPPSSRSESPVTPISISSSPYGTHRPHNLYHRRPRTHLESDLSLPPISSSCPPSKSILNRTPSVSTKDSRNTASKSVKFAAIPTVHYACTGYWDLETIDDSNMGINIESMDVEDPFTEYPSHAHHNVASTLDIAEFRELQCVTPTPERERQKANTLKRFMSLTRKPPATTGTSTTVAIAHKFPPSASSNRPTISTPYALGGHPSTALQSTASLRRSAARGGRSRKDLAAAGSALDITHLERASLRSTPSYESFRSSKSAGKRSVRSLGSVKSTTSSHRGLRTWFGRTVGWTEG